MMNQMQQSKSLPEGFTPLPEDILCGRGCAYVNRPGNRMFSAMVQDHLEDYSNAVSRMDKTLVVATVLNKILDTGARFVKKGKGTNRWYEMTREEAHHKTGHAIRDTIRQMKKSGPDTNDADPCACKKAMRCTLEVKKARRRSIRESYLLKSFYEYAPAVIGMDSADKVSSFGSDTFKLLEEYVEQVTSSLNGVPSVFPFPDCDDDHNNDNEPVPVTSGMYRRGDAPFVSMVDFDDFDDTLIQPFDDQTLEGNEIMQTAYDILFS
jgi:hypothetical protein